MSWDADWEHSVKYLCHLLLSSLLLGNGNCQGQNIHLYGLSVCLNMDVFMFVGALKTLAWEAVNPETMQVLR